MPEHFHLMISEPELGTVSTVMQVLKQRVSRRIRARSRRRRAGQMELWPGKAALPPHFWQPRSYDFNVWSFKKYVEKLRYMHRNPVARGLVQRPEHWRWSSYRFFAYGELGAVKIDYDLPDTPLEQCCLCRTAKHKGGERRNPLASAVPPALGVGKVRLHQGRGTHDLEHRQVERTL